MKITTATMTLPAAATIATNPLPALRDQRVHLDVRSDGTLAPGHQVGLGRDTARRVLPYLIQDRYDRKRRPTALKTIILENDRLRATFLPDFGGRLYALTDIASGRELLFTNPVFQPAHLAIRNAWFSGGIEWNIGQYGHTFFACAPLFCAKIETSDGPILRMWEYERQKRLYWQIDFHLPQGQAHLEAHVRIINPHPEPTPMYWWTNIAVPQAESSRVFSGTKSVLFQDSRAQIAWANAQGLPATSEVLQAAPVYFGRAELPDLSDDGATIDATYPLRYRRAAEYFFQLDPDYPAPWEAVGQADGTVFWERSTQPLRFRKMFCWGDHDGGRWWCDFLAEPGRGSYLEIQSGLAPTQLHGYQMPGNCELEFTQVFGSAQTTPGDLFGQWETSRGQVNRLIDGLLDPAELARIDAVARHRAKIHTSEPDIIHQGSGWGALEAVRDPAAVPDGWCFPAQSLGPEQAPWLQLLRDGTWPDGPVESFMTDPAWAPLMTAALASRDDPHLRSLLGVLMWENLQADDAVAQWRLAIPDRLALRNLALAARARGQLDQAVTLMKQAVDYSGGSDPSPDPSLDPSLDPTLDPSLDPAYAEEYLGLLIATAQFDAAWALYNSLPPVAKGSERCLLLAGRAALEIGQPDFTEALFTRQWSTIREGDNILIDLWFRHQAHQLAAARGQDFTEALLAETMATKSPPRQIDSRMVK